MGLDELGPDASAGKVGPLYAVCGKGPDHRTENGDDDGEADRVPQEARGQRTSDQVPDVGGTRTGRLGEQEGEREREHGDDGRSS